jgi:hypothetical protein
MFIYIPDEEKDKWYNINHIAMIDTYIEHPSENKIIRVNFTEASGLQPIHISETKFREIMNISNN